MTREPQQTAAAMTELEKLGAGLEHCFDVQPGLRCVVGGVPARVLEHLDPAS